MKIRIIMLKAVDQLEIGHSYLLDETKANELVAKGKATKPQSEQVGPSETKPVRPSEVKESQKKRHG